MVRKNDNDTNNKSAWGKTDWLVFFRRAKKQETLETMFVAAYSKAETISEKANIILGHEARENELGTFR
ncbi:hypothetical protein [Enterovibrio norvegicus]|uniref:hypothetical protein n=1 Tax=Enterovibrio norvegicus TaxID=188144 RepID=UPI00352F343F